MAMRARDDFDYRMSRPKVRAVRDGPLPLPAPYVPFHSPLAVIVVSLSLSLSRVFLTRGVSWRCCGDWFRVQESTHTPEDDKLITDLRQQIKTLQKRVSQAETEKSKLQTTTSLLEQEFVKTVSDLRQAQQQLAKVPIVIHVFVLCVCLLVGSDGWLNCFYRAE